MLAGFHPDHQSRQLWCSGAWTEALPKHLAVKNFCFLALVKQTFDFQVPMRPWEWTEELLEIQEFASLTVDMNK